MSARSPTATSWSSAGSASRCCTRRATPAGAFASEPTAGCSPAISCSAARSAATTSRTHRPWTWSGASGGSWSWTTRFPSTRATVPRRRSGSSGGRTPSSSSCEEFLIVEFTPPRGTEDLLPPGAHAMAWLYERVHRLAQRYGYRYVETPAFESTELFARSSGQSSDIVSKEMYTFEDRGGRSLTLRPESTAPVVRAYLAHQQELGTPFKAYYVELNWRYGRPQKGRLREFRQFGVEVIGVASAEADVEVIVLGDVFLRDTGLSR